MRLLAWRLGQSQNIADRGGSAQRKFQLLGERQQFFQVPGSQLARRERMPRAYELADDLLGEVARNSRWMVLPASQSHESAGWR